MLLNLSPTNCDYRGEGNAGFVVSLKREEKVLRFVKKEVTSEVTSALEDQQKELENKIAVVKNVMKPLLGENLVNCPTIVFLHAADVEMLNKLFSSRRPKFRTHRCVKEENSYVLMLPDYCTLPPDLKVFRTSGPVISVEIKPKQGFLLKEDYWPSSLSSRSLLKCRYCMMQHYKLKRKTITVKSEYCPTDLFSGCPYRIQHALKMLLETPQNNLRIFKDQELVYSEEKRSDLEEELSDFFSEQVNGCDVLCKLVMGILLRPFAEKVECVNLIPKDVLQDCANAYPGCSQAGHCHELPAGCVLYRILCIQMMDRLNIRNLYPLFLHVRETEKAPDCIGCFSMSEIPPYIGEMQQMEDETNYQYASRKVWEFLVALTAKDCSIMLVLKHFTGSYSASVSKNFISDDQGNSYLFSIAIADLDAKPLNRVEKHYKMTPMVLQSCFSQSV